MWNHFLISKEYQKIDKIVSTHLQSTGLSLSMHDQFVPMLLLALRTTLPDS